MAWVEASIVAVVCFVLSYTLTLVIMQKGLALGLVQVPNARSSHVKPTPSGGGIGFAVISTCSAFYLMVAHNFPIGYVLVAAMLGVMGGLDDRFDLPALVRLVGQILCAAFILLMAMHGELPNFAVLNYILILAALLGAVWLLNFVNFMDGIDGLVGSQAVAIILAFVGLRYFAHGTFTVFDAWAIFTAVAVLAFLMLNHAPAKIFMGDAGSYFLSGFFLSYIVWTCADNPALLPAWLILFVPLMGDAIVTLTRRVLRRQNPMKAHRENAYQILSRQLQSHGKTTYLYLAALLCVFTPLAVVVAIWPTFGWSIVFFAYLIASIGFIMLGAGTKAAE
jgi:Fuc2NAc and GlcNAc transferase